MFKLIIIFLLIASSALCYDKYIKKYSAIYKVNPNVVKQIIMVESSGRGDAIGRHGEIGLMQIKYSTARHIGYRGTRQELFSPSVNIKYGVLYFRRCLNAGGGLYNKALYLYNHGLYKRPIPKNCYRNKYVRKFIEGV